MLPFPVLRPATAADRPFLTELVAAAVNWAGAERVTSDQVLADPRLAHYVTGFPGRGESGVVAVDRSGPQGAAWLRLLPAGDRGWGFVAEGVPELSMAVVERARGARLGRALLDACLERARQDGLPGVSLSVEDGNDRARGMYQRSGFRVVGRECGSDTMLFSFDRAPVSLRPAGRSTERRRRG